MDTRAPKSWCLGDTETLTTFEGWQGNQLYSLTIQPKFAHFLLDTTTWKKKSATNPTRGFTDDAKAKDDPPIGLTGAQKCIHLELMLAQIANYCPVISRNSIIKKSISLVSVWQMIRLHYNLQLTGGHFLDIDNITLKANERAESLYQRLLSFVEDNLLTKDGGITHHEEAIAVDEDLTPTLENFVVLTWLRLLHPELPRLVRQRYCTQLRSHTLASIKTEISQAIDSLLDELRSGEEAKVMRSVGQNRYSRDSRKPSRGSFQPRKGGNRRFNTQERTKTCPLCTEANKPNDHFLSSCPRLPESDKRYMSRVRQLTDLTELLASPVEEEVGPDMYSDEEDTQEELYQQPQGAASIRRVNIRQSPFFKAHYRHHTVCITLDTGAEASMIRASTARDMGLIIRRTTQSALQADGITPLGIAGEVHVTLNRNGHNLILDALAVENLEAEVLGGSPFMVLNDVHVRPKFSQIYIGDNDTFQYKSSKASQHHSIRRASIEVLRAPKTDTIWPGEFVELDVPTKFATDTSIAIEPRIDSTDSRVSGESTWPTPCIVETVAGKVRISNPTSEPKLIKKNEHLCQAIHVSIVSIEDSSRYSTSSIAQVIPQKTVPYSSSVKVDPENILTFEDRNKFINTLKKFDGVFSPDITGYNGAYGPFKAVVNMGPVQPPQRKGRVPQYARDRLVELQAKFDALEGTVFKKPEDIGITVEYLNPSFLVKKTSGDFRLVTAFADVGRYCKPQPSLMPDVDSTLRTIARWKYIIVTDLSSAFYQIPLDQQSMKYCGVATPFRGVRVYTRCAMGMPGSETALEELMCRVLGDSLQKGTIAKLADDLYCGGNTPAELLQNWCEVLTALEECDLKLSPRKTVICPKSTVILGWVWCQGSIHASTHRIATLSTCKPPETVKGMRSFIGAYKVLGRVISGCSVLLSPLDDAIAGLQSADKVKWNDNLAAQFSTAQKGLLSHKAIVLPQPSDQLWIVTDGSVKECGAGATLYATRRGKPRLAGFFSCKLRKHQVTWLPCEIEALSIAAAVKHFSPFIIQSTHKTCLLTDSKPCVQAIEKLCRGEFSASPRVTSFLTIVSRYQVSVQHLAGSANVPSDFSSRNAVECMESMCQVCSFINKSEQSVVMQTSVHDILHGATSVPFASRKAWLSTQTECPDLRRVHSHLIQGTRPNKKLTKIPDIKRYLGVATIARDGLLVTQKSQPLSPTRECIIVPRQVLHGLLTALHIKLDHPSKHQLKLVTARQYFALDIDRAITDVTEACHTCASLKSVPAAVTTHSTSDPPPVAGIQFAADVMKRNRQLIFILRECVTSYTATCIIDNERKESLAEALILLTAELHPLDGPCAVVRVDPAPGFMSLKNSAVLNDQRIAIEIGEAKNLNKNPVAEKAVQELGVELLKQCPKGGAVSKVGLAMATARLNSRIRSRGLSAREMWFSRDQFTNEQLPVEELKLINEQHQQRLNNHAHSSAVKDRGRNRDTTSEIFVVGDIVYVRSDRSKCQARDRYLVVAILDKGWAHIKKFVGSQLRAHSYKVRFKDLYRVPSYHGIMERGDVADSDEDEEGCIEPVVSHQDNNPPVGPPIPTELAMPEIEAFSHNGVESVVSGEQGEVHTARGDDLDTSAPGIECNGPPRVAIEPVADMYNGGTMVINDRRTSGRMKRKPAKYDDFIMYQ